MQATFQEIKFTDADVVNPDDFIPANESNPHNVRPWLFHDHGFVLCVVFADCLSDALDVAADGDKLDRYSVNVMELNEYKNEEGLSWLGNTGTPFDIESLGVIELPNPKFSFIALFNAID